MVEAFQSQENRLLELSSGCNVWILLDVLCFIHYILYFSDWEAIGLLLLFLFIILFLRFIFLFLHASFRGIS